MSAPRPLRIAVTGAHGQLATALKARQSAAFEILTLARPEFDLANPAALMARIAGLQPDLVINAAAWTAVDAAETHEADAFAINCTGAGAIARAAAAVSAPIIQISTDYVFAGDKAGPYLEDDPTGPRTAYGRSKLAGEAAVRAANPRAVIARTSWVYGPGGANFVKTILRLAGQRPELGVVADQRGRPTYAPHLAEALLAIAPCLVAPAEGERFTGILHMAGADAMSWHEFALAIFTESAARGGPVATVKPIATVDYPTPAPRPANSVLDVARLRRFFGIELPGVVAGLRAFFDAEAAPPSASKP